jgi:hypothetical protein
MIETYCKKCGEIKVLTEEDTDFSCCDCDCVLEIIGKWSSEGGK